LCAPIAHRRVAGRTQQQLARAIGLHPDVLSHKMNASDNAVLTTEDVIAIVTVLADWGVLAFREEAEQLLALMAVPPHAVTAQAWSASPLRVLRADVPQARVAAAPVTATVPQAGEAGGRRMRLAVAPLPAPATALIGRVAEVAQVAAALSASRLVTLTGMGGSGKTRLALRAGSEVAGRFADGVAFADLSTVNDPDLLAAAIAAAIGLAPPFGGAAEDRLTAALADRELLLVLDNLEQLLDGVPLLARLLTAAPALRILATSRIALRIYGEHTLRVPPLSLPGEGSGSRARDSEAVRLFIERARAAGPGSRPSDGDLDCVAAICTVLDGLPLAIELAAARTRLYSPGALLHLLESRLALLTDGPRDLPRRQQTLRAALDWSYQLLSPQERSLLASLGTFSGPFDVAAAGAVSGEGDAAAVLGALGELADQSMIEVFPGATPRFQLRQTMREYALARLSEAGAADEARRRHLGYFMAMAENARGNLALTGEPAALDLLEGAYPNIRAALEFAIRQARQDSSCLEAGMRLATAAGRLWLQRGPIAEGQLQLGRLLALDDALHRAASPAVRAAAAFEACELFEAAGGHRGPAAHRLPGEVAFAVEGLVEG
jgi:predicted ATPase